MKGKSDIAPLWHRWRWRLWYATKNFTFVSNYLATTSRANFLLTFYVIECVHVRSEDKSIYGRVDRRLDVCFVTKVKSHSNWDHFVAVVANICGSNERGKRSQKLSLIYLSLTHRVGLAVKADVKNPVLCDHWSTYGGCIRSDTAHSHGSRLAYLLASITSSAKWSIYAHPFNRQI